MNNETYQRMEDFVYGDLMENGDNDVEKVTITITVENGHVQSHEYYWNKNKSGDKK